MDNRFLRESLAYLVLILPTKLGVNLRYGDSLRVAPGILKTFSRNKTKRSQFAFTLVESIIAMGVIGIVLVSLFGCFTFGFNVVRFSREDLRASQILQEKMEAIRLYTWKQLNQTNFVNTSFTAPAGLTGPSYFYGKVEILDNSASGFPVTNTYAKNLRLVKVSLTWTNNGIVRTRETSTFVSQYGLQNYIYN